MAAPAPAGRVIAAQAAAPLVAQPGAVAPNLRDPHAEFRKGRWQRPAAFSLVGAAALGGLFFLAPGEQTPVAAAGLKAPDRAISTAIGSSLPPERISENDAELTEHKAKFEQRATQANDREAPVRPAGIASDSEFSRAFKAAASH